jgi:ABC-type uncharacterized transport system ATPase subunit
MKKLAVKLKQDCKSFKSGDEISLEGDLMILTGLNGAGKSHFFEAITGDSGAHNRPYSQTTIDSTYISKRRSF